MLNRYGRLVDAQHTSGFAGGGANPAGKFREIIGAVQDGNRLQPVLAIDGVVELGDDIPQGAAVVAEWDPAIHTTGGLFQGLFFCEGRIDFLVVAEALFSRARGGQFARVL